MRTITIDKSIENDLARASKLTGIHEGELANRALLIYLKRMNDELNLAEEFTAWDELSDEAWFNMERELEKNA